MAKLTATTYERPTPAEKPNPFLDHVKQFTDKGIDTAFAVEFEADEYKAEKLLIQKAVNAHGFSAREVKTTWNDEKPVSGKTAVHSTFVIRPARKSKGEATDTPEAEEAAAE